MESTGEYRRGASPAPRPLPFTRKRSHEQDDMDEDDIDERRQARRRSNEYVHSESAYRRRSLSSRPSEHTDRGDHDGSHRQDNSRHDGHHDDMGRHPGHDGRRRRRHSDSRSKSPARHHHSHRHSHSRRRHHSHHHRRLHKATATAHETRAPEPLPYNARPLSRSADFVPFRPVFARYLDIQKQIDIASLDEREVRGRWKSFVSRWNNGELAEGWYQPETFEDVLLDQRAADDGLEGQRGGNSPTAQTAALDRWRGSSARPTPAAHAMRREIHDADSQSQDAEEKKEDRGHGDDDEDDYDDYGPMLPTRHTLDRGTRRANSPSQTKHGPGIPTLSDLTLRRELEASAQDDTRALLRQERKADRTQQRERLDELAPRADAGSQARRLEKRREVRDANAAFANAKASSGDVPDLADTELMGGDGGGIEEFKRLRQQAERKKTEREIRREEILRAKQEEREERIKVYREREAVTVDMLREIARSRFG
ncbi:hypothetical protein F5Y14DRAFT_400230 [Nemania sp. NC0429]|nr:hypothetical protein F5Y14DRAFT_400230 [Nemania sp. NC0429]